MAKIGVIGEKDFALLFTAVGLDVFFEESGEGANRRAHKLAREGYAAVFITDKCHLYTLLIHFTEQVTATLRLGEEVGGA